MSATGVQLSSELSLTYFHPTIREYLQDLKQAVGTENLPAAKQALAQLGKAIPSEAQGQGGGHATSISQALQDAGTALEAGNFSGAEQAVGQIHDGLQSISAEQKGQAPVAADSTAQTSTDVSSEDGNDSEIGPNLNVRV
ncbi:MAG: hypothetical protein WAK29_21060 [Terriglobales bacterium]